jgi:hypothetical protein
MACKGTSKASRHEHSALSYMHTDTLYGPTTHSPSRTSPKPAAASRPLLLLLVLVVPEGAGWGWRLWGKAAQVKAMGRHLLLLPGHSVAAPRP